MEYKTYRIAILASGQGTNAEHIFSYFKNHPYIDVGLLISSNPKAYVIKRAKKNSIPIHTFNQFQFQEATEVLSLLAEYSITHLVLAGFLWLISKHIINEYPNKIINIHPSLLPHYGGRGMYGMNVHKAVKEAREKISGITIHLVDNEYDTGKIIFQKQCTIKTQDTPKDIASKVHQLEHIHYAPIIKKWIHKNQ